METLEPETEHASNENFETRNETCFKTETEPASKWKLWNQIQNLHQNENSEPEPKPHQNGSAHEH